MYMYPQLHTPSIEEEGGRRAGADATTPAGVSLCTTAVGMMLVDSTFVALTLVEVALAGVRTRAMIRRASLKQAIELHFAFDWM